MSAEAPLIVGRYSLYDEIASGGMASVHYGRLLGAEGFSRTVALKRLRPQFAKDPDFVAMFLDEARLAARIRHPNVVPTLDVVAQDGELFLVMEYVEGESLARLVRLAREDKSPVPVAVATAIVAAALRGLHAAHEATNEKGEALDIIHRDVSPQNILVGLDGVPRVLDFGVARAIGRAHITRDGVVKGKLAYMSPEQLQKKPVDRRTDIFAAGVVLWELLTGRRLLMGESEGETMANVLLGKIAAPSTIVPEVTRAVDAVTLRALAREPNERYGTARQMAIELEQALPVATQTQIAEWVDSLAHDTLTERSRIVSAIESGVRDPRRIESSANEATVSDVRDHESRVWRGSRRWWAAGLAFGAGVIATSVVAGLRPSESSPPVTITSVAPALSSSSAAPETLSAAPPEAPAPSETASAVPPPPKFSKPVPRPPAQPASKPCTVKSTVDESGVKHFFRDCK